MKRNLIKGLIICAFATSLVGVGTTLNSKTANASTIKEGVVTASLLNVRSSDSIHSNIIGGLSRNTKVNIINIGDKWDKIRFGNKEGYVYNAYISHMYEGTQQGHVVNISSSLRVRSGASTSTATKGFLRNGAKLDIVGKSGAWYKIKYNGGYGFVHGDYVSVSSASKPAEKPSKPAEKPIDTINEQGYVVNISSSLRVRSGASTNTVTKGFLRNGAKLDIVGRSGAWYKIKYNGGYGFVHGDYVSINKHEQSHDKKVISTGHVVNISSSLRVRSGASTSTATKGFLRNGTKLDIVGKSGAWYEIKYDGGYGFVHGDYVSVSSASKPAEKPTEQPSKPAEKPNKPAEKPTEQPSKPAEKPSKPAEKPTEQPSKPVEVSRIEKAKKVAKDYIGSKNVGVYCTDLTTGESFGINENKIYYSASTGKLPGILYTQKKLNEGAISTNTKYAYHDYVNDIPGAMIRGGTGVLQNNIHDGKEVSVGTLLKDTCEHSDNLASNMLGYYVCDKNAGAFKEYTSNIIGRHIGTFAKEFSAKETALLMKEINNQGGQAIQYLKNTDWDNVKIPKYLPVPVAHKIGINGSYNHDVAIVYGNHPYVISVMSNGASDEFIAQLSKKVYNEMK
ncbi:SH3 domain-containing protein [Clostridium perfringens]|uniref:SH3 domain-containing protein n=1 Tax=Clostridium perfringens TaxID=1502 RepID=UPI0024BC618A|nr:SH3 domain-containing protein [Clostridium perfringens]